MAALLYTLILVLIDAWLLYAYLNDAMLLISATALAVVLAVAFLFTINSFLIKFLVVTTIASFCSFSAGFELNLTLLFYALYFHVACLWCEIERFFRSHSWEPHYKVSHKMRHNWLGGLCFFGGLLAVYTFMQEYEYHSPFYSLALLCIMTVANLAYFEANRLHNINAFWVEVAKPLAGSGQYWRIFLFSVALFVALGINFSSPLVTKVLEVRESLTKQEETKKDKDEKGNAAGRTTSGFNPGEVKLSNKVDIELSDAEEFYVRINDPQNRRRLMNEPLYMGAQELVIYNGSSWIPKNKEIRWFNDADDGKEDGFTTVGTPQRNSIKQTIYFIKPEMSAVFALPGLHTIHLPEVYLSALGVLGIRPGATSGNRKYTVFSSYYSYNDLKIDKSLTLGYPEDEYFSLPDSGNVERIQELTKKVIKPGMSLLQRLDAIKLFLAKNCKYSLKVENKNNRDPLENFLFDERKGHCLLYASAFTIMLRQAGIPARLVNGFAGGSYDKRNDLFIMKSSHAHAWTEVYFNRYGWVVVDPTPEADNIQPNTSEVSSFAENDFEAINMATSEQGKTNGSVPGFLEDTDSIILAICTILVLFSYSWQFIRRIPALAFKNKSKTEVKFSPKPDFILSFERLCLLVGVKVSKSKTPREMLKEITKVNGEDSQLEDMISYYYQLRFADGNQDLSKESSWNNYLASLIKRQKSSPN